MTSSDSDSPELPPGKQPDPRCAGCPGCDGPSTPDASDRSGTGGARAVLGPAGFFLFPVVMAIGGALLGSATAMGELLGGLAGLGAGMAVSILVAGVLRPRPPQA